jgi:hypothetical protein
MISYRSAPFRSAALAVAACVAWAGRLPAQQPAPCDGAAAPAFDFWIGNWTIAQRILAADGSWLDLPAHTSVSRTLDGCALIEHWQGEVQFFWEGMQRAEPMAGLSLRAYDPATAKWYIHWMDTRSPRFGAPYAGNFANGRGEFYRETATPNGTRRDRITFRSAAPDSVQWALAVSSDSGATWRTIWTMAMTRDTTARKR